ncbi:MAG: HIT family protein [Rhodocyclaceae bacterium]|nr:HIT family protein [Rhodocyclaceae bacterium]
MKACELCDTSGGDLLWQDGQCRVVQVAGAEGAAFPGFCRVIWQAHVQEMSDLAADERHHLIEVVHGVEAVVRELVRPDKINLASLGNVVPHLHWHVIPRWRDDSHFPAPIWAAAVRPVPDRARPAQATLARALADRLGGAA